MIFVFGANESGIHGAGAAKYAKQHHGAIQGVGFGHFGNSFAIPTKDKNLKTLSLAVIKSYVNTFINYAINICICTDDVKLVQFKVTRIGCGLAGYKDSDIAPLFKNAGQNCYFDEAWREYLPRHNFWGTF